MKKQNEIKFTGEIVNGTINLDLAQMVCVPHIKYRSVELCIKTGDDGESGWNLGVGDIVGDSLPFEEKVKLGKEIEKRWNKILT